MEERNRGRSCYADERAEIVRRIVESYYEEGRHDRCKLWVYRNIVRRQMPVSELKEQRHK